MIISDGTAEKHGNGRHHCFNRQGNNFSSFIVSHRRGYLSSTNYTLFDDAYPAASIKQKVYRSPYPSSPTPLGIHPILLPSPQNRIKKKIYTRLPHNHDTIRISNEPIVAAKSSRDPTATNEGKNRNTYTSSPRRFVEHHTPDGVGGRCSWRFHE